MKTNFSFQVGNRGLLPQEMGLAELVNESLLASARRQGVVIKPDVLVKRVEQKHNGNVVLRVSVGDKAPVEVPLAA